MNRGYRSEKIRHKTLRVDKTDREMLKNLYTCNLLTCLKKTKPINGNMGLAMTHGNIPTFHSVINAVFEICKSTQRHIERFEDLERVLLKMLC